MADYFNFQSGSLELLANPFAWVYSKDTKSATRIAAVSPYLAKKRPLVVRLGGLFTFANRISDTKALPYFPDDLILRVKFFHDILYK